MVAMTASTRAMPTGTAAVSGALIGVVVLVVTYVVNAAIRSRGDVWTS